MRTLKFRAWHEKMGWANEVTVFGDGSWSARFGQIEGYDEADGVVLTQFTGLKDKQGKEIYEGDIVQNQQPYFKGIVYFKRGSFWVREIFSHVDEGIYDGDREKETQWSIDLAYKIIGNIYETPELLERT